ncbi:MAG: NADH-quinone oxidoreductase subunit L [Bdellovibrionales bacterium RIFOXYD1_FULL_53_11]|nr:MAG: NADH-quinone oxidoreductase subunit L [Bdellovibrionales bacterium RIFOXYD1_FULL_53_11]
MLAMIIVAPLAGFLLNGLWYFFVQSSRGAKKAGSTSTGLLATAAVFLSFVAALAGHILLLRMPSGARVIEQKLFGWIHAGGFALDFVLRLDPLSSLFCLVITGVGTLIHIYSIGYMSKDSTPGRYFAYLNLFCAAMLLLVLGASMPVMFIGWEGVGLCSYLLIGYWHSDILKAAAGKKAFIVNRIGDLGFVLGMFVIYRHIGSLDFFAISSGVSSAVGAGMPVVAASLLLFAGCVGKSAQIPLYVWLPDAMAGPTPVSALIHAATMVTGGVYLMARVSPMLMLSSGAMLVIAGVGAATALFAGAIAFGQNDIKKILAYSTISQLGYMFLACGVGAAGAGVFHVITHSFFKALLFLGAGSVIHAMGGEQDIRKMGGLRGAMPRTFITFAAAWLAISGIPPLSGFFSKDEILWRAFSSPFGGRIFWAAGMLAAVMTAAYMTRLFSLVFLGGGRASVRVHESPATMTVPLFVLGALSVAGGFIGIPGMSAIGHWLEPVLGQTQASRPGIGHSAEWVLLASSAAVAAAVVWVTLKFYEKPARAAGFRQKGRVVADVLENKFYIDELYGAMLVRPLVAISGWAWKKIDDGMIDSAVLCAGRISIAAGALARKLQTGQLQAYALAMLFGALALIGYLVHGLG